jgi:HlyD family secretion protein
VDARAERAIRTYDDAVKSPARWHSSLALAGLLGAAALSGCTDSEEPQVRTDVVGRATVAEVVEAPATVTAKATAALTSPATGRVARLAVREGERVRVGQVLLRIASPQARHALAEAERADAEAAEARVSSVPEADVSPQQSQADRAARRAFEAAEDAARGLPAGPARRQALAAVASARAQYAAAQAQADDAVRRFNAGIDSLATALSSLSNAQRLQTRAAVAAARRTVDALVVRAPIAGTVQLGRGGSDGASAPQLGDVIEGLPDDVAGQAEQLLGGGGAGGSGAAVEGPLANGTPVSSGDLLLRVADVSALALTAEVDETDVLLVKAGVRADVELDAVPGATYAATVQSVDLQPTTSTRGGVSYVVRLSLGGGRTETGDAAPVPRPGMSAVTSLKVRTAEQAVAVPVAAVFAEGRRDAVWVVEDGVARKRLVELGAEGESSVEVVSGLEEGERVVVGGADRVTDGERLDEGGA